MLKKKMWRDIFQNKSQFITIFLMVLIGVMVYTGIEAYMDGMTQTGNNFYEQNNLQDINVLGSSFTKDDLKTIKNLSNVQDAERKLVINAADADDKDKSYSLNFIESNNISKFYVEEGKSFDYNLDGAWLDYFYAKENNIKVGDTIRLQYDTFTLEHKVAGLIYVPDHLYDTKDESALLPNHKIYGFVYLSAKAFPAKYLKEKIMKENNIPSETAFTKIFPNFDYTSYIPYNYIMVDVDKKDNVNKVKNEIEDQVTNAKALINIEDTASYTMYQGEIDEGSAYVGVFSGLFLFIALLSVITTMTRVVKKQKLQIGTLKALGFKNYKIILHYVGYGFWVSLLGAIAGMLAGYFFLGATFLNLEMQYFEVPNGHPVVNPKSYLVSVLVILAIAFITYLTCRKELSKNPAESLRNEMPSVKTGSLNLTSKGIFNKMNFSTKWNIRDILRNKFRTVTGIVGVVGCCMLIVCAFGMLNSMNHFIKLQFEELYNFDYKLSLKENLTTSEINELTKKYGNKTSETLGIEIKDKDGNRKSNNAFVYDAGEYIRFKNNKNQYMLIDNDEGIYVTYKLAETNNYHIGDTITWHIYGDKKYYKSKIVGFNKDPQNQNITMTRKCLESLNIEYLPTEIYTNQDLHDTKNIKNVEVIQDIETLKDSITNMLSMMRTMIIIIIFFAIILGAIILYNMGILSYSEKQYQFATLKVLGFKDKQIKKIYIKQNNWIAIISIILGLPLGYYLTSWLFKVCLDEKYDFGTHINVSTYILAALGTFLVSYIVSYCLAKKVNKIDMVSSLKANE